MFFLVVLMTTVTPQKGVAAAIVPEKMALINAGVLQEELTKLVKKLLLMKLRLKIFISLPTT